MTTPAGCSIPGPLPRWLFQCSPEHARELYAPKPPAQDQQRQLRVDFYWAHMTVDDTKAQGSLTDSLKSLHKKTKHLQNHCPQATSSKPTNNEIRKSAQTLGKPKPTLSTWVCKRADQLLACCCSQITFSLSCYPLSSHRSLVFTLFSCAKTLRWVWGSEGWELSWIIWIRSLRPLKTLAMLILIQIPHTSGPVCSARGTEVHLGEKGR